MKTQVIGALCACFAFGLAGCRSGQSSATPGCPDGQAGASEADHHHYTGKGTQVRVVNTMCPVAGSHGVGKGGMTDEALVREHRGQMVGFCCGGCPPVWDKMTEAKRDAALAAVMKNPS